MVVAMRVEMTGEGLSTVSVCIEGGGRARRTLRHTRDWPADDGSLEGEQA